MGKNEDPSSTLNGNGDDILQKALERIGLPLADGGAENSGWNLIVLYLKEFHIDQVCIFRSTTESCAGTDKRALNLHNYPRR